MEAGLEQCRELPRAVRIMVRSTATGQVVMVSTSTLLHVTAPADCAQAKEPRQCLERLDKGEDPDTGRDIGFVAAADGRRPAAVTGAARKQDGFIIVAVLWMVAALAVLAAIFTRFALTTAVGTTMHEERLQAEAMLRAGVELTAFQITATDAPARPGAGAADVLPSSPEPAQAAGSLGASKRPTKGAFSFRLGGAAATIEYRTEAARVDLNAAPKEAFAGLFRTFGAKPEDADFYADRIIGWRKKAEGAGENAEATEYRVAGLRYGPRQAPFQSTAELWLVFGIPTVLKERILPFVTVYSGQPQVDPANAAPEVLASMPEHDAGTARQRAPAARVAAGRGGDSRRQTPGIRAAASRSRRAAESKAYRLTARVVRKKAATSLAEVVILVAGRAATSPIASSVWRDDFDGWR